MGTDRPAVDRKSIINWVSSFLGEWEESGDAPGGNGMLYDEAAEIIVNQILNAQICQKEVDCNEANFLPNPSGFFRDCEDR